MGNDHLQELSDGIDAILRRRAAGSIAVDPQVGLTTPPTARRPMGVRTILVVEDNKDYRSLIRILLASHSYHVLEAADGQSALEQILQGPPPDLIILDFNMPKMNGYEFLQELRSHNEFRRLSVIMFTGAPNRRHLKDLNLDITEFLEKPVTNGRLLESVRQALESAPRTDGPDGCPAEAGEDPGKVASEGLPASVAPAEPAPSDEGLIGEESLDDFAVETADEKKEEVDALHGLEELAKDSPLINRVNLILMRAVEMRASDVHIEPSEDRVNVRVRVDGSLRLLCTLPSAIHPRLTARIKIMSNLSITERRRPQDGQFRAQIKGAKVEFRISTLPCTRGEKIVLRILGQARLKGDLESLELPDRDRAAVEKALHAPHGLILVTGPTGSGKTTTLYTMVSRLNRPDVNIVTAEDPVEYELPGISQVRVRPTIGLTFESTLRAFLRQDPDIMLIGEIRDLETAEIAVKASITGRLVFSTLHTNSAPASMLRLTHMGVAPYLVAASVRLVIAQRLVRKLCPRCKIPARLSDEARKFMTEAEAETLKTVFRALGCAYCHQTGYAGRKAVFEVMPIDSLALRQLIINNQPAEALQELVVAEGLTTLRQAALRAAAAGETSVDEALKIMLGG